MRKADLKAGALLLLDSADERNVPVTLLDTKMWKFTGRGARQFEPAEAYNTRPNLNGDLRWSWHVGYLVVTGIKRSTLTPADVIDADGNEIPGVLAEGSRLLLVNNRDLVGEYDTEMARIEAQRKAQQDLDQADQVRRHQASYRLGAAAAVFERFTGTDVPTTAYDAKREELRLSLDQAELLAAALRADRAKLDAVEGLIMRHAGTPAAAGIAEALGFEAGA